ncbi:hypothetical protein [Pseudoalteromonas rubra]|uniref:Uncharacterized protein n=1 Tax=Pseudoalteromonas rubra TaxID=43658 RepID=A0A5S3X5M5_9GAMM|nr:hypothetical protein [Pseudoalteromonas rubra]TMP39235.1 hypothetical protein CWB98_01215 [Pseudoalteromonas rubra]
MKLQLNKKNMKALSVNSHISANQTPEIAGGYYTRGGGCTLACDSYKANCDLSYGCKSEGPNCATVTCL